MFAVALAVGLTPELLPMITTVTLSRGAIRMARRKVIVKRLASIHDLGSMTVLCTDKTGTLTSAEISLARSLDLPAEPTIRVPRALARSPLSSAVIAARSTPRSSHCFEGASDGWTLAGRHAFDFSRRVGSVLANGPDGLLLIVKGAPEGVAPALHKRRDAYRNVTDGTPRARLKLQRRYAALPSDGLRGIAIASRPWSGAAHELEAVDEADLVFEGLCAFADPPKPTCRRRDRTAGDAGIRLKILSGDDPVVVKRLAGLVGLKADTVLSGVRYRRTQ